MVVLPCVTSADWARILTGGQDRARLSPNDRKDPPMTVARLLAAFLTDTKTGDLPARALDYAAMVIASTLASAAFGTGVESAQIIRAMAQERGARGRVDLVRCGGEIAGCQCDSGQCGAERYGRLGRQRSPQYRSCRYAADR